MGMFEQSLLLDHAVAKKTGALAASLTVQTLLVGVVIALPLIYGDRLPNVRPLIPLTLPFVTTSPPTPEPVRTATSSSPSRANSGPAKIFRAPSKIADLSAFPEVGIIEAPQAFSTNTPDPFAIVGAIPSVGMILPIPWPKSAEAAPTIDKPVRVVSAVQEAKLLKKVIPVYPPLARQARVSGTVQLIGVIAKDGTIQQLQVVSGHPLLIKSALDAVRQWVYRPTLLNGQAVEVIAPISVIFTLSQ
jgi:protein TonB